MTEFKTKVIHAATIRKKGKGEQLLLLKQTEPYRYLWVEETPQREEVETGIWGGTAEEAIQEAFKNWRLDEIKTFHCGFRYTLPERDEVGTNALLHQMASSYSSMNGFYFDEDLSANCIVQNASLEARLLWKRLQDAGKM